MTDSVADLLPAAWRGGLVEETLRREASKIDERIRLESMLGCDVFPPRCEIFAAINDLTPNDIRVVVIGQDPYVNYGEANGLCFSVKHGIHVPPSLKNIYDVIESTTGNRPETTDLSYLKRQGVLLLNTVLTVASGRRFSHRDIGWERVTTAIIRQIEQCSSSKKPGPVYLLWGKPARETVEGIVPDSRCVRTSHPSPLSAHRGFMESDCFNKVNNMLGCSEQPIDWSDKQNKAKRGMMDMFGGTGKKIKKDTAAAAAAANSS